MAHGLHAIGIDAVLKLVPGSAGIYDIQLDANGDIAAADQFDTAIIVSLFTDARAGESAVSVPELRRGWIGNEHTPGETAGGLLWLWEQSRLTGETVTGLAGAAEDSLQWMVAEGYAVAASATAVRVDSERIGLNILITKPTGEVETRLFDLWRQSGVSFGEEV